MKAQALLQEWQRRPVRERLLVSVVTVALLAAAVDGLWTVPMEKRIKRAQAEITTLQGKVTDAQAPAMAHGLTPEQSRQQEAALRQRLQAAQAASLQLRQRVAEAARLPETLRTIVGTVGSARLLELNLAGDADPAPSTAAPGGPAQRFYRLPISLKVSGNWDELQLLLSQIERHADALQWQSVALDNSDWPSIQLTLKAHVLSLEPRWGAS